MKKNTFLTYLFLSFIVISFIIACGGSPKNENEGNAPTKNGYKIGIAERVVDNNLRSGSELPEIEVKEVYSMDYISFEDFIASGYIWQFDNLDVGKRFIIGQYNDDEHPRLYYVPIFSEENEDLMAKLTPEEIIQLKSKSVDNPLFALLPVRLMPGYVFSDEEKENLRFAFSNTYSPEQFYCIMYNGYVYRAYNNEWHSVVNDGINPFNDYCEIPESEYYNVKEARIKRISAIAKQYLDILLTVEESDLDEKLPRLAKELEMSGYRFTDANSIEATTFYEQVERILTENQFAPDQKDKIIALVKSKLNP